MAWIYRLTFQPGGKVEEIFTPSDGYFVLPDGRRLAVYQRYVWCFGCSGLSWAEWLWSAEDVEETIRTWEDPDSEARKAELTMYKLPDQKQWKIDRASGRAYAYRDLLLARTEPCHCMTCGGTEFAEVPHGAAFT